MRQHLKGMPNWKAPGPDRVYAFWMKNVKSLNERLAHHLQVCVVTGQLQQWMTMGRTVFLFKDEEKDTLVSNFPTNSLFSDHLQVVDWHDGTGDL